MNGALNNAGTAEGAPAAAALPPLLGSQPPGDSPPPEAKAERDNNSAYLRGIRMGDNNSVKVVVGSQDFLGPPVERIAELSLVSLSSTLAVTAPTANDFKGAVAQLRERRVLMVECTWDELQWSTVVAIAVELGEPSAKAALGRINDTTYVDPRTTQRGVRRFGIDPSWSIEALTKHELAKSARVIVLELDGEAGNAQLEVYFASHGALRALAATLAASNHFLLLMPRGHTRLQSPRSSAYRSLDVPRLSVPFITCWLNHRFPESDRDLEEAIRQKLMRRDWENEAVLYGWLSTLSRQLSLVEMRQALDDSGEPKPLQTVRDALDHCDEKDDVLLTAVFVATYFPSLPQQDFADAVTALLGDRTRKEESAIPDNPLLEISLADEWQRSVRGVFRQADLELRDRDDGARTVVFRAAGALRALKKELDATPLFVDSQLEHLQSSGLLFSQRPALGDAVVEFLATSCTSNPSRFNSGWLLQLFGRRRLRAGTSTPSEVDATSEEEWASHAFLRASKLLRRLLEKAKEEGPNRFPAVATLVNNVIGTMLHRSPQMAAAAIELAYCLRLVPGFEFWRWVRRGLELPHKNLHKLIGELLNIIVTDPAEGAAAIKHLFAWLADEDDDLSATGTAAASALGESLSHSFEPPSKEPTYQVPALIALLQERAAAPDPKLALAELLALLVRHIDIELVGPRYLATLILPHKLRTEIPLEAYQRQLEVLLERWATFRMEHAAAWQNSTHRTALRLAMFLGAWGLAPAQPPELVQKLASAASEHLRTDYRLAQEWIGRFHEVLEGCEARAATDAALSLEQRKTWLQQCRERRQQLLELRRWLHKPSAAPRPPEATDAASPPSDSPSPRSPS